MADADFVQCDFGYIVGGTGTDDTEIFTNKKQIKMITFAGNADNATGALTTKVGTDPNGTYTDCGKFKTNGNDLDCGPHVLWFGETGSTFNGLKVNLSHASDRVYIHVV